jgi:hypothetical protein
MTQFDREKYLRILKSEGADAALTALHADIESWEQETFEGEKGYQPDMWKGLFQAREFSRELWEMTLKQS